MAHFSSGVEYGLHALLALVGSSAPRSAGEVATYLGISPTYVAKIMAKLEKHDIVRASEGAGGGYILSRDPADISVLEVTEAIDGARKVFRCSEMRRKCVLFEEDVPAWARRGPCSINRVMMEADAAMRSVLSDRSLADIAVIFTAKAPEKFLRDSNQWFSEARTVKRGRADLHGAAN